MFGRKKKNETPAPEASPSEDSKAKKAKGGKKGDTKELAPVTEPKPQASGKRRFKRPSKKLMLIVIPLVISVCVAGFVVYKIYFSKKEAETVQRIYVQKELPNIILVEEIIRFTFDFMPEFYDSSVIFNESVIVLENEINRLTELGKQFPDQIKIADKEIKVIEKEKNKVKLTYEKLQKKVEALYVSYRVNKETGIQQIEEQKNELAQNAKDALTPVLELTKRISTMSAEDSKQPEGFVKGTVYKIKQKISNLMN